MTVSWYNIGTANNKGGVVRQTPPPPSNQRKAEFRMATSDHTPQSLLSVYRDERNWRQKHARFALLLNVLCVVYLVIVIPLIVTPFENPLAIVVKIVFGLVALACGFWLVDWSFSINIVRRDTFIESQVYWLENYESVLSTANAITRFTQTNMPSVSPAKQGRDIRAIESECVYLIKDISVTGYIKIGRTNNLARRLGAFKVQLPFEIEVIHIIRTHDSKTLEAELHRHFADKRVNGEWFNLTVDDVERLRSMQEVEVFNVDSDSAYKTIERARKEMQS